MIRLLLILVFFLSVSCRTSYECSSNCVILPGLKARMVNTSAQTTNDCLILGFNILNYGQTPFTISLWKAHLLLPNGRRINSLPPQESAYRRKTRVSIGDYLPLFETLNCNQGTAFEIAFPISQEDLQTYEYAIEFEGEIDNVAVQLRITAAQTFVQQPWIW